MLTKDTFFEQKLQLNSNIVKFYTLTFFLNVMYSCDGKAE